MTDKSLKFLVRHGEEACNPESQDARDILTDRGVRQIELTAAHIAGRIADEYGVAFDDSVGLYHSTKTRARASADVLADGLGANYAVCREARRGLAHSGRELVATLNQAEEPVSIGVSHLPYDSWVD